MSLNLTINPTIKPSQQPPLLSTPIPPRANKSISGSENEEQLTKRRSKSFDNPPVPATQINFLSTALTPHVQTPSPPPLKLRRYSEGNKKRSEVKADRSEVKADICAQSISPKRSPKDSNEADEKESYKKNLSPRQSSPNTNLSNCPKHVPSSRLLTPHPARLLKEPSDEKLNALTNHPRINFENMDDTIKTDEATLERLSYIIDLAEPGNYLLLKLGSEIDKIIEKNDYPKTPTLTLLIDEIKRKICYTEYLNITKTVQSELNKPRYISLLSFSAFQNELIYDYKKLSTKSEKWNKDIWMEVQLQRALKGYQIISEHFQSAKQVYLKEVSKLCIFHEEARLFYSLIFNEPTTFSFSPISSNEGFKNLFRIFTKGANSLLLKSKQQEVEDLPNGTDSGEVGEEKDINIPIPNQLMETIFLAICDINVFFNTLETITLDFQNTHDTKKYLEYSQDINSLNQFLKILSKKNSTDSSSLSDSESSSSSSIKKHSKFDFLHHVEEDTLMTYRKVLNKDFPDPYRKQLINTIFEIMNRSDWVKKTLKNSNHKELKTLNTKLKELNPTEPQRIRRSSPRMEGLGLIAGKKTSREHILFKSNSQHSHEPRNSRKKNSKGEDDFHVSSDSSSSKSSQVTLENNSKSGVQVRLKKSDDHTGLESEIKHTASSNLSLAEPEILRTNPREIKIDENSHAPRRILRSLSSSKSSSPRGANNSLKTPLKRQDFPNKTESKNELAANEKESHQFMEHLFSPYIDSKIRKNLFRLYKCYFMTCHENQSELFFKAIAEKFKTVGPFERRDILLCLRDTLSKPPTNLVNSPDEWLLVLPHIKSIVLHAETRSVLLDAYTQPIKDLLNDHNPKHLHPPKFLRLNPNTFIQDVVNGNYCINSTDAYNPSIGKHVDSFKQRGKDRFISLFSEDDIKKNEEALKNNHTLENHQEYLKHLELFVESFRINSIFYFKFIDSKEWKHKVYNLKKAKWTTNNFEKETSPQIFEICQYSQNITRWVQHCLLIQTNKKSMRTLFAFFIQTIHKLLDEENKQTDTPPQNRPPIDYLSAQSIFNGLWLTTLNIDQVCHETETLFMNDLKNYLAAYSSIKDLFSTTRNSYNIRNKTDQSTVPCIPIATLITKDLTNIFESFEEFKYDPAYITSLSKSTTFIANKQKDLEYVQKRKVLNFNISFLELFNAYQKDNTGFDEITSKIFDEDKFAIKMEKKTKILFCKDLEVPKDKDSEVSKGKNLEVPKD